MSLCCRTIETKYWQISDQTLHSVHSYCVNDIRWVLDPNPSNSSKGIPHNYIAQQIQGELNISYIYALEVFTIICITFVFSTLTEYAIAIRFVNNNLQQNITDKNIGNKKRWFVFLSTDPRNCIVDVASRIIYPTLFVLSLVIYCLYFYYA